jgi:hypothetical protein
MRKITLSTFLVFVSLFFIFPGGKVSADTSNIGPQAGNCSWGKYDMDNTVYVSTDGSSAYDCSGGTNCQDAINAAINAAPRGGTVYLKNGLYAISKPIRIKSNLTIDGDQNAVVQLKDHADWKTLNPTENAQSILDPIIGANAPGGNAATNNVTVKCFTIDGNKRNNESTAFYSCIGNHQWQYNFANCETPAYGGDRYHGNGYYTLIKLSSGSNYSVHDMTFKDALSDGVQVNYAHGIKFYNNNVIGMGHEGFWARQSDGIEVYKNSFVVQASDGVRSDDSSDYIIHDNDFQTIKDSNGKTLDSSAGVQIGLVHPDKHQTYNVQIYGNVFHDIWNGGVWLSSGTLSMHGTDWPVSIHHNIFEGNGLSTNPQVGATGGIIAASGADGIVYNNVFDGNYGAGINALGSGLRVVNNIIVGSAAGKYSSAGNGVGVAGAADVTYNCFYNNFGGDGSGSSDSTNVHGDPLFANHAAGDYHLQSTAGRWNGSSWVEDNQDSPCIDAGYPLSDGNIIDIGVYGNTSEASKSSLSTYALTIESGTGTGSYEKGSKISISANATQSGQVFNEWTGDTAYIIDANSATTTVTMPDKAINLSANYKDMTETYSLAISNGNGSGSYTYGKTINIAADAPIYGLEFSKWTGDTAYVSSITSPTATVTMPAQAISLTARYKVSHSYLTVKYGSGSGTCYVKQRVTITANAAPSGKVFYKWTGNTAYISSITSSTATVTMPYESITLTATYRKK